MTESLVDRLNASSGFETFTAGDGKPSLRPNTRLMKEAADRIANLERALNVSTGRRAAGASRAATMTEATMGDGLNRHVKLTDGTIWPLDTPDPDRGTIEWKLRYSPDTITKADHMHAASILATWARLTDSQTPLDPIIKQIREIRRITKPPADTADRGDGDA